MAGFSHAYELLNDAQRQAVDTIDGPLMVLAGPGTGKTQLLATRVANIIDKTDTLPQNILCLTFTESGAQAMRERLGSLIGVASYDVRISTYHSFGSEIIREYPDFFSTTNLESGEDTRLERPIDDLTKTQIVEEIVNNLSYDDALKSAKYYIKSVVDTLGECKKSLLTPQALLDLASENLEQITQLSPQVQTIYTAGMSVPRKSADAVQLFSHILKALEPYAAKKCLAQQAHDELAQALDTAAATSKTSTLTAWKNKWLTKNETGEWEFVGRDTNEKIRSLARIYSLYQHALRKKSLYDFDDMILRTIDALHAHPDLLFNLQERYQYILLDEFQDTNAAQFALVQQLANHPVHEGRPNVMAVGDDDQAIYAFQGADVSNMLQFIATFRDVTVINLTQNYRSHHDIIHTAHGVADQIESRLHHQITGITKTLEAASTRLPKSATIQRHEFASQADEYSWVANQISELIKNGVPAKEIAVLSPKHSRLESLVPFLNNVAVPVSYEKRENILDTPVITALTMVLQLAHAAGQQSMSDVDTLMPAVLSLDFWNLPTEAIWRTNWARARRDETRSWAEIALENEQLRLPVLFLLELGSISSVTPLEYMLDYATGVTSVQLDANTQYTSPFKEFYFSEQGKDQGKLEYFEAISHLSVIRAKLRDYQTGEDAILTTKDFTAFVAMYRTAEQPLINSHPIAQRDDSVFLMTAYKSKGLEFEHVFLLSVHDNIWGAKARGNTNKVGLPANLQYIRYFGSGEDELRRLLFVAITRAKHGLYLTSHAFSDTGKANEPVKYLLEFTQDSGRSVGILPASYSSVIQNTHTGAATGQAVELLWQQRHTTLEPELRALLKDRLASYKMSPTHVNTYINLEYGGPEVFLLQTLLRFPQAPGPDGEFGNAIHSTLDWYQKKRAANEQPSEALIDSEFDRQLAKRYIDPARRDEFRHRGHRALARYLASRHTMFEQAAKSEVDFAHESVVLDGLVHLSGKIDRLEINQSDKTIHIVDFKTGRPITDKRTLKYLTYTQQLYIYKLLIEGSQTYRGYTVLSGRLEFVEPDRDGIIAPALVLTYDAAEEAALRQLLRVVWTHITNLALDDTTSYSPDYRGSIAFIQSLINEQST